MVMLLRRAAATCAVACLAVLAACDDGPPPATVGTTASPGPATEAPRRSTYVALGDSYTAAPGVPQTEQQSGCLRSNGNYPTLVAHQLRARFVDVSCVGATTAALTGAQSVDGHVLPAQLAALGQHTSLVTLGIGGNDLDLFQTAIGTCGQLALNHPKGSPCRDYYEEDGQDENPLLDKIHTIGRRVTTALERIHRRAPKAEVVLVGYPQPVPPKGTCQILPLAPGDYPFARSILSALDAALKRAAAKGEATYIDMEKASRGHDICAGADAWINGVNTDIARALAFHPFAAEQQAVADLIMAQVGRRVP
jgi:lysophospholipase L1-like esterase